MRRSRWRGGCRTGGTREAHESFQGERADPGLQHAPLRPVADDDEGEERLRIGRGVSGVGLEKDPDVLFGNQPGNRQEVGPPGPLEVDHSGTSREVLIVDDVVAREDTGPPAFRGSR